MQIAAVNLQLSVNSPAEFVVRDHPADGALDEQFRMPRASGAGVLGFVPAYEARKTHEALLFFLFAGEPNFFGVDHDDEIASVDMGGVDRLFFAAQEIGSFHRDLAEHLVVGINNPPLARHFVGFCGKGLHQSGKGTEITGEGEGCQLLVPGPKTPAWRPRMAPQLLIIAIMRLLFCSAILVTFSAFPVLASEEKEDGGASGAAVVREMNLARQNPALYATFVQELRSGMNGNVMVLPGGVRVRTKEGTAAVDEAIRFLQTAQPLPALTVSRGMSRAAADHCADQADGGVGHAGRDRSRANDRMARYGTLAGGWAENISYGKSSARAVVLALIIDDGLPARKHRKNIFNPNYSYAGAAFGRHARFGTMCSMDFAGGYAERGQAPAATLVARNF